MAERTGQLTEHITNLLAIVLIGWSLYNTIPLNLILPSWLFDLLPVKPPIETYRFRWTHLALILLLATILQEKNKILKVVKILVAAVSLLYPLAEYERFIYSSAVPNTLDVVVGLAAIAMLLHVVWRSSGLAVTILLVSFIIYGLTGYYWPEPFTHRGYELDRLVGHLFMTLEGIFGVAIDVSASLVILFIFYGALMDAAGASKFFTELVYMMMGRSPSSPGRATVLLTGLIGGPQGSGVATTLSVGPLVKDYLLKAGYKPEKAAGLLSAGGMGAVISPPLLGAAAFLMVEFLRVPLLSVLIMVTIPTLLLYLDLYFIAWLEAKAYGFRAVEMPKPKLTSILRRMYHLASIAVLVGILAYGRSPGLAIAAAVGVLIVSSFLSPDRSEWITPRRLLNAFTTAAKDFVPVGCILAGVGIVIGVFTLTGLGLKLAGIIVAGSAGIRELALFLSGVAVILVGLAVPITASYVVTVVVVAPALHAMGIPTHVSHIFVFYYSVLSEVSPPIGLSPMAAASLFGAKPFTAIMEAWRYSIPAFLVPYFFSATKEGEALLLLNDPANIQLFSPQSVIVPLALSTLGVILLSIGRAGYFLRKLTVIEGVAISVAGALMGMYPSNTTMLIASISIFAMVLAAQLFKMRATGR
ncbi:MAG: TRAP transporter fused permease subunit [Candidatus Caldarchaeum sp.]|uniref:TRAP transporter fused permease subunit n=1 Tax=Caldiarchaeum subterraneum TaxID=311458 RepID=A0A7C5QE14_CALS0